MTQRIPTWFIFRDREGENQDNIESDHLKRRIFIGFPGTLYSTRQIKMEDLITAISGNMHVSQDGYDIKALQVSLPSRDRVFG